MNTLERIIILVKKGINLFITGGAGSGKSYLLRQLKDYFKNDIFLTASTGIAAINIGGMTVHSFAKLGLGKDTVQKIVEKILKDPKTLTRIINCKILAIDEISMLSGRLLNTLNNIFQVVRSNEAPFGGIKIILFGDFLQLPPIFQKDEENEIALNCKAWRDAEIETILLNFNYRQSEDKAFFKILESVRLGENLGEAYGLLKERVNLLPPPNTIQLVSHREQASTLNNEKLANIFSTEISFKARIDGKSDCITTYSSYFAENLELRFKKGARVMLTWNLNIEEGLSNGSLGVIVDFSIKDNAPIVLFDNKITPIVISPHEILFEDTLNSEILFKITQVPLQLAYGLTIHKSQGLTFKSLQTDISKCFASGQAYVSLSRAQTLTGLFLKPFSISVFKYNPDLCAYYAKLEHSNNKKFICEK